MFRSSTLALASLFLIVLITPLPAQTTSRVGLGQVLSTNGPVTVHPLAAYTYTPCVMCMVAGDAVFFNANTTYPLSTIKSFTWDFGDGSANVTTSNPNVSHVFSNTLPGRWTVTLSVQDSNGQTDSISQQVLFNVLPKFTFVPDHPMAMHPVVFNASSTVLYQSQSGSPGFEWSFGDGASGTGEIAEHTYSMPGPYRVSLTVVTSAGNAQISEVLVVALPVSGTANWSAKTS